MLRQFMFALSTRNIVALVVVSLATGQNWAADRQLSSDRLQQLRSLLSNRCFACHGPDAEKREGGFRLDQGDSVYQPADSGNRPVVPGSLEDSHMVRRIVSTDDAERMPPPEFGKALEPDEIALVKEWVSAGAPALKHWSFMPPTRPQVPGLEAQLVQLPSDKRPLAQSWLSHPIDRFVLTKQIERQLAPSDSAPRDVLLRRLSLDLIGLPPSADLLDSFIHDARPDAVDRVVDRLLASPEYGEHWARKWLDLARYADSAGYADDPARTIWAYRDWVIRALNSNMPLDKFSVAQLAGDLVPEPSEDDLIATAFHRNTLTNNEGGTNDEEFRNVAIVDRVNTTMAVWMGLTFACAQCHTHKYDPLTQEEYFKVFDIFNQSQDADRRDESPLVEIFTSEQLNQRKDWQAQRAQLQEQLKTVSPQVQAEFESWSATVRQPAWQQLKPTSFGAKTNTEATWDDAGRVRVKPMQDKIVADTYTLELTVPEPAGVKPAGDVPAGAESAAVELAAVQSIGLRTIPLKELPGGGAGLGGGNFVLTDFRVSLVPKQSQARQARYVRFALAGKQKMLSLAEVQVLAQGTNVAQRGKASQSSTDFGGEANRAIDGKTVGDYTKNSVTHTAVSDDPWWEVDLGSSMPIDRVVFFNRTDNNLQSRLNGVEVSLLNADRQPVFTQVIAAAPKDSQTLDISGVTPLKLAAAYADFSQPDFSASAVIDSDKASGWAVGGQIEKEHLLTLIPAEPIKFTAGSKLRIELAHESSHRDHLLASFEVLVSHDSSVGQWAQMSPAMHAIALKAAGDRTVAEREALQSFYAEHLSPANAALRANLAQIEKQLASMKPETSVPIMRDMAAAQQRKTYVQLRGNYKSLGPQVTAGVPAVFHAPPADKKMDRLQLAEWLMSRDNPLTARVLANRTWEALFGLGIVRTSEEFGSQGDLPSHPELLDWLATELMDLEWDHKNFLRTLVLTRTYQQTSEVSQKNLDADGDNVWLARGPRVRLSAEMVRDQALAAAGLISHKMFGPPVRPPQPSLGLTAAFGSKTDWEASQGEDRYRRGVYTTWRRSNPYPSMATFDAPSREVCTLRRDSTNTPLQAVVTLNDPGFVEAAQALARRVLVYEGANQSDRQRLQMAFHACTSRSATERELSALEQLLGEARAQLAAQPSEAKKLATEPLGPLPTAADPIEAAAWTAVGNVLLNLDEVLMKR
ncbi:MAG: DUF1553 domain-containing protein [Pirellulaceae bacterium]|nr:DUF1553 domain-containing protein [Pirellulaceae bacterium]